MLIAVVVVFLVCQTPYVVYNAVVSILRFEVPQSLVDSFSLWRLVSVLLVSLKSAVNFVVYCWFSEEFWVTVKRFCGGQRSDGVSGQNGNSFGMRRISTRDTATAGLPI